MPRKKTNSFLKPTTFEIEGWEFPQYGSLRVYERDYLLERQQERNNQLGLMISVAEKLAEEKGMDVEQAFDMLRKGQFSEVELAKYKSEVDKLKGNSGEDGIRDQVSLLLRSRLSHGFLKANNEALEECYGIQLGPGDLAAFKNISQAQRFQADPEDDSMAASRDAVQRAVEAIIAALPGSTYFKMAEFIDMEIEGVDSPEELQALMDKRNEEAEATDPKTPESSSESDEEE